MAPIPPNNTQRFWVDYTVSGHQHTLLCRAGSTVTPSDAGGIIGSFFAAFADNIYLTTIDGFRSAAPGVDFSTPQTWPGAATYGNGTGPNHTSAWFYDFVGRGDTGHRVRAAVFGAKTLTEGNDYRITPTEASWVADVLAALTSDGDIFLDVDYGVPIWKNYANSGTNAYWRNKLR